MSDQKIIAIGLLNASDLEKLGSQFAHAFPVDDAHCFEDLLAAIDQAEGKKRRELVREDA